MEKDIDITVVGSIFMDLISYADRMPKPGETLEGSSFQSGFGGKGANQCVAASRLGSKCAMIGKLGMDAHGKEYLEHLTKEGIDTTGLKWEEDVATGVASIIVGSDTGENLIVICPGATSRVLPKFVEEHGNLVARSKFVVCQLEVPIQTVLSAFRIAKAHGSTTIFNVAPGSSKLPAEVLQLTDILCVNEIEAEMISGKTVSNVDEAHKVIQSLLEQHGQRKIIITLGSAGAVVWDNDKSTSIHYPAPEVKAVDSTGAGDCFVGTLAHGLAKGLALKDAVEQAIKNSAYSVTLKGTQYSFPKSYIE